MGYAVQVTIQKENFAYFPSYFPPRTSGFFLPQHLISYCSKMGERKKENPLLFCFLILPCHLIPSFLWPFVSAGFHSNNHQQAVCIPPSSLCTDNSKQGQNQLWIEEESRRFISFSLMLMCACLKACVYFCASISLGSFGRK